MNFILLGLCLVIARSRGPAMLYIFFGSFALGSVAVIPPQMVGGVTLSPTWVYAMVICARVVWLERNLGAALMPLFSLRRFGLLTLCTIYATISAFLYPRLFRDAILIIPMRLTTLHVAVPLEPSSANITQTFYFALTTAIALSLYLVARQPALRRDLLNAILFGGIVMVLSGLLDMATAATGTKALIEPLRTASYALMTDVEIGSTRRVVGLQPEASAYAGGCMNFLAPIYFMRGLYVREYGRSALWVNTVWVALVVMIYLSTSSGGIVGLAVLGVIAIAGLLLDVLQNRPGGWSGLGVVWLGVLGIACIYAVDAELFDPILQMVNTLVFEKTASASYVERSMWNRLALDAFTATNWLGAGLGSVRASSWVAAVLGNIGLVGAVLMFGFLLQIALARGGPKPNPLALGAKFAMIPILTMETLSGTSVGFGPMVATLAAIIGAASWSRGALPYQRAQRLDVGAESPAFQQH